MVRANAAHWHANLRKCIDRKFCAKILRLICDYWFAFICVSVHSTDLQAVPFLTMELSPHGLTPKFLFGGIRSLIGGGRQSHPLPFSALPPSKNT